MAESQKMEFWGNVASIAGPVIELLKTCSEPIQRHYKYFFRFHESIQNLRDEAGKLEQKREGLQMRVDTHNNNAHVILPEVEHWLQVAGEFQLKMVEIEKQITSTPNGYYYYYYYLCKKVNETAEAMKEFRESCNFDVLSQPPQPSALVSNKLESTSETFESRKAFEEGVIASLRDDEVYTVGIWGMAGIGKTTIAKGIMHNRAREEHLFEEIVMVVVGRNADMVRVQDDIARLFGLNLGEGSLYVKAHLLRTRLSKSTKKSLIIVDDVWEHLNLDDLGIPCSVQCKILLTSRDSGVMRRMNVEKVHELEILDDTEAWCLFAKNVGSCIDHPDVASIAQQVVQECKGLPGALVITGSELKDVNDTRVWNDRLHQLKSSD